MQKTIKWDFNLSYSSMIFITAECGLNPASNNKIDIFSTDCDIVLHWPSGLHLLFCTSTLALRQAAETFTVVSSPR